MTESDRPGVAVPNDLRINMLDFPEILALYFWGERNIPDRQRGASITIKYGKCIDS
jgi:hypothetical protein